MCMSQIIYPLTLVCFNHTAKVYQDENELLEYLKFQNPTVLASLNTQLKRHGVYVDGSGDSVILKQMRRVSSPLPPATLEPVEMRISIKI